MRNIFYVLFCTILFAASCRTSNSKIESKLGITDSVAQSLLKIPLSSDFSVLKSHEKELIKAISYFKETKNAFAFAYCSRFYGLILSNNGDFKNSQYHYLIAYDIFEKLDKKQELAKLCNNIGRNYVQIGSMDLAFKYYNQSVKISQQIGDSVSQATVLQNIGLTYRKKNPDSSLYFYQTALSLMPEKSTDNIRAKIKYNIANYYFDKKDFAKAKVVYQDLLNDGLKNNKLEAVSVGYNALAAIYLAERKIDISLNYYKQAIHIADSIKHTSLLLKYRAELIKEYEFIGDFKNAFIETKSLKQLSDSLLNKEKEVAVHELDIKYQSEKKEADNIQLRKEANYKMTAIVILIIIALILYYLFKSRSILVKEKTIAYDVLIDKYKSEKQEREKQSTIIEKLENAQTLVSNDEKTLLVKILEYYTNEKPYLNSKLRVDDIAKIFNTTQKEIASVLKNYNNSNFNSFTNKFRVEAARIKFEDPAYNNFKMEVISEQSGFGTLQSFYNAFELYTGVKPGYYRMKMLSK
jgi:AraC-like DNA-binding protein